MHTHTYTCISPNSMLFTCNFYVHVLLSMYHQTYHNLFYSINHDSAPRYMALIFNKIHNQWHHKGMYLMKLILRQVSNKIPSLMNKDNYIFKFLVFTYYYFSKFPTRKVWKDKNGQRSKSHKKFLQSPMANNQPLQSITVDTNEIIHIHLKDFSGLLILLTENKPFFEML